MDVLQATMAVIYIAKEIMQYYESKKEMTEEKLASLIAGNLIKLDKTIEIIKADIAKYGGK